MLPLGAQPRRRRLLEIPPAARTNRIVPAGRPSSSTPESADAIGERIAGVIDEPKAGLRGGQQWVWHRTPGFGDTNWTDVITILRMAGFKGAIDIEGWHDPVYKGDLEMTGQVHALNYLKQCRGGAFVANPV